MAVPVGCKQEKARGDQCKADEERVIEQGIQQIAEEGRRDQRERRDDEKQDQPPSGRVRLFPAIRLFEVQHQKPLAAQALQLCPIGKNDGPERPQVQQHVKEHLVFQIADAQKILQNCQMA